MAKILFGGTIGDARGSIGAATYTKSRFGAILRQKVSPVQPRSARVLTIRGLFTLLTKRWFADLTDAQRLGWIALAAANPRSNVFGNSIILTGLQMYVSLNRNLQNVGQGAIDDAPANLDVDALTTITPAAAAGAATFTVAFSPTPVPVDHKLLVEATLQVNAGRSFVSPFFRFIQSWDSPQPSSVSIFTTYTAIWGGLRAGQKITVRARQTKITTGATSVPLVSQITVAA